MSDATESFGVGEAAKRTNVGKLVGADSKMDSEGKVYEDGELFFDPTEDSVELIGEDDKLPGEDEESD